MIVGMFLFEEKGVEDQVSSVIEFVLLEDYEEDKYDFMFGVEDQIMEFVLLDE